MNIENNIKQQNKKLWAKVLILNSRQLHQSSEQHFLVLNIVDKNLFPAPESSYNEDTFIKDPHIEQINSQYEERKEIVHQIPYLVIPYKEKNGQLSDKYLIYFHGNAEDIGLSSQFLQSMQTVIKMNIIAVEYPGYGIYRTRKTTAECIKSDALTLYDYINKGQQYSIPQSKIAILGRSIGSGPASYVASSRNPRALILISPYVSIKELIKHHVSGCVSCVIQERFNNLNCMNTVASPVLLIHGLKDTLIPPQNSYQLELKLKSQNKIVQAIYHPHMTHNDFDERNDISMKIKDFLAKV